MSYKFFIAGGIGKNNAEVVRSLRAATQCPVPSMILPHCTLFAPSDTGIYDLGDLVPILKKMAARVRNQVDHPRMTPEGLVSYAVPRDKSQPGSPREFVLGVALSEGARQVHEALADNLPYYDPGVYAKESFVPHISYAKGRFPSPVAQANILMEIAKRIPDMAQFDLTHAVIYAKKPGEPYLAYYAFPLFPGDTDTDPRFEEFREVRSTAMSVYGNPFYS